MTEQALSVLVPCFTPTIRRIVHARVPSREVDDIVQEVWLRAVRAWSKAPHDRVGSWLATIARNLCTDHLRKRQTHSLELLELDPVERREDPDDECQHAIRALIADLPVNQREAMVLFHFDGLSYKELAVRLHATPSAINQRLSRARAHLRRALPEPCKKCG